MGVWNTDLTGPVDARPRWPEAGARGRRAARCRRRTNTDVNNSPSNFNQTLPLSQYGVSAMDKLFTLYDQPTHRVRRR